jgi:hypothetical protein
MALSKAMGLLLHYENHQTRRSGCWIDFTAYNLRRIFNLIDLATQTVSKNTAVIFWHYKSNI